MKITRKAKEIENPSVEKEIPNAVRNSDEPVPKKAKWVNKQRVLILALRGITYLNRHLMKDLCSMLPHSKKDNKMEKGVELTVINEIAGSKNCNKCILFENRRKSDLYMWLANIGNGPTVKFLVENIYTMKELKLTGNCLKGSRPLLSFDDTFQTEPHYKVLQEIITQIFSTPNYHPQSQPFIDHVFTFKILDGRIWFRNYQILTEDGALAEIGPRFVLNPIKIFAGSFGGEVLWDNPNYLSTSMHRRQLNRSHGDRYLDKKLQKEHRKKTKPKVSYNFDTMDAIFDHEAAHDEKIDKPKRKKSINPKKGKHEKTNV